LRVGEGNQEQENRRVEVEEVRLLREREEVGDLMEMRDLLV
jgi:hypothetical protein